MKIEFSPQIFEKYSNIKFHENPSSGSRVVPCGRADGHEETDSRLSPFLRRRRVTKCKLCHVTAGGIYIYIYSDHSTFKCHCGYRRPWFRRHGGYRVGPEPGKVKFTLEKATKAQRWSRGIALLFP